MSNHELRKLHTEFLDYCKYTRGLSRVTLRAHKSIFNLLLERCPLLIPETLTPDTLNDFFRWLQTRERTVGSNIKKTGVSQNTIATYWKKLTMFFSWLCAKRVIPVNPLKVEGMKCPGTRYDDKQYLDRHEVEKILAAISFGIQWKTNVVRTRNVAVISVAVNCGLRRGELLGLKLTDVHLERRELVVRAETSKSRRSRTIPLNARAFKDVESYLSERRQKSYGTAYLWVSEKGGGGLTDGGLKHAIKLIRSVSGVNFHLHQLRHTFAVNFLHNSWHNSFKLQALLGHSSIVSTAIYTRCLPVHGVRREMERMSSLENTL